MHEDADLFREEEKTLAKRKAELLKIHPEQFFVIKGSEISGPFATDTAAFEAAMDKYGELGFMIRQLLPPGHPLEVLSFY